MHFHGLNIIYKYYYTIANINTHKAFSVLQPCSILHSQTNYTHNF